MNKDALRETLNKINYVLSTARELNRTTGAITMVQQVIQKAEDLVAYNLDNGNASEWTEFVSQIREYRQTLTLLQINAANEDLSNADFRKFAINTLKGLK